jgi:hypothetical protein
MIHRLPRFIALLVLPLMFSVSGCDRNDHDDHHLELHRVQLFAANQPNTPTLSSWNRASGWSPAALPEISLSAGSPLSVGVRMFDEQNREIHLHQGEFTARYALAPNAAAGVIDVSHPASHLFFTDRVDVYGQAVGTTEIVFQLWHAGHADAATAPIQVQVVP